MSRILCLTALLCGFQIASAEYYLKFSTSGAPHDSGALAADSAAWIDLSIVDVHPTDGPIHYEKGEIGSFTKVGIYLTGTNLSSASAGSNNLHFYVADVPRSLTVTETATGQPHVITAQELPQRFSGAPAFLLPDGLLVATGLSHKEYTGWPAPQRKIYIAAAMPVKAVARVGYYPSSFGSNPNETKSYVIAGCLQGWAETFTQRGYVQIWQYLTGTTYSNNGECVSTRMYAGKLSHVIRMK